MGTRDRVPPDRDILANIATERNELVRRPDDAVPAPVVPLVDVKQGITIELPEHIEGIDDERVHDDERSNQRRLFAIREFIRAKEGGEEFAWLPQAIEALLRSQRSDFLPELGKARGISIRPDLGIVQLVTVNREGEAAPFELRIDDLRPYSLELSLAEVEAGRELPAIAYSDDMSAAVAGLPEDARFRWELISRAARTADSRMIVKTVTSDMMFGGPEGVGVFVHNDRPDAQRWSLEKVTGRDIPLTARELGMLEQAQKIHHPEKFDPVIDNFFRFLYSLTDELKAIHGLREIDSEAFAERARLFFKRFFGTDPAYVAARDLDQLTGDIVRLQGSYLELADTVRATVIGNKGKYRPEYPFETMVLPAELTEQMQRAAKEFLAKIAELAELIQKVKSAVIKKLESAPPRPSPSPALVDEYAQSRRDVLDKLGKFEAGALTTQARALLGDTTGEKKATE